MLPKVDDDVLKLVVENLRLVDACALLSVSKRFASLHERRTLRKDLSERDFKQYFSDMSGRMTFALDLEEGVRQNPNIGDCGHCFFECKQHLPADHRFSQIPLQNPLPLSYKYFEPCVQITENYDQYFKIDLYLKKHLGRSYGDVLTDFQFSLFAKFKEPQLEELPNEWREVEMHPDIGNGEEGKNTTSTHIFDDDENGFEGILLNRRLWDLSNVRLVVSIDILATNIKLGLGPMPGSTLGVETPVIMNFYDHFVRNSFYSESVVKPSHVLPCFIPLPKFRFPGHNRRGRPPLKYNAYLRRLRTIWTNRMKVRKGYLPALIRRKKRKREHHTSAASAVSFREQVEVAPFNNKVPTKRAILKPFHAPLVDNSYREERIAANICFYGHRLCSKNIVRPQKGWIAHSEAVRRFNELRMQKIKHAASFVLSSSEYCANDFKFFLVARMPSDDNNKKDSYIIEDMTMHAVDAGDYSMCDDLELDGRLRRELQNLGVPKGFGIDILKCHRCGGSIHGAYIKGTSTNCVGSCCFQHLTSYYKNKIKNNQCHYHYRDFELSVLDDPEAQM